MAAPTISWSTFEAVQSPSDAQDTRSFSATIGVNSKAVVVVVAASAGGADVEFATIDGVTIPNIPGASVGDGTNRVAVHALTDLSAVTDPGSVVVEIVHGTGTYLIWVGVIDSGAEIMVLDSGTDTGGTPWSVALDSGAAEGLALAGMAKTGGQDISDGAGQTRLASHAFLSINDEAISSKLITGAGSMSFTASAGAGAMGAAVLGGTDVLLTLDPAIEAEWEIAALAVVPGSDVMLYLERLETEWEIAADLGIVATAPWQVRLVQPDGVETVTETEGGEVGDVLTLDTERRPGWEAPGGGVADHGALTGLADDDHPQYATDADLTAHEGTPHGSSVPAWCRVNNSTTQALAAATLTPVTFDTEEGDTDGIWTAGTPTVFTIPTTHPYVLVGYLYTPSNGTLLGRWEKNAGAGWVVIPGNQPVVARTGGVGMNIVAGPVQLAAGDQVRLVGWLSGAANLGDATNAEQRCSAGIWRL